MVTILTGVLISALAFALFFAMNRDFRRVFKEGDQILRENSKLLEDNKTLEDFKSYAIDRKYSSACGDVQRLDDDTLMIGWGHTVNDAICMSVYDFTNDKELLSIELANPQNFTYRCVYYD